MADQFIPDSVAHHFRASTSATVRKGVVKILAEKERNLERVSQCSALTFDQDVFCEALFYHSGWITQLNLLKEKRIKFILRTIRQTDIKTPTYCILGSCSL